MSAPVLVALKSIQSERPLHTSTEHNKVLATFLVDHDNEESTLVQTLTLTLTPKGWVAEIPMDDFPPQKTVTASAWKLADWLERMAEAIKAHEFSTINLNNL